VDYNSVVKKGQVIAELDKSTLAVEVDTRKSSLNSAKSEYTYQKAVYERKKKLFEKQLLAAVDYEAAVYTYEKARNNYEIAKDNMKKANTNLGYATIYSPIDGIVLSRSVEEGQTVASSFNTPTLFIIAADLTDMQVIADVDEADIGAVKEGQTVQFTVDSFPFDVFEGKVEQVRQEATTTNNVVTYEVVISALNPELKLKPGMTASVNIFTVHQSDVLVVPNSALSFNPRRFLPANMPLKGAVNAAQKVWTLVDCLPYALEVKVKAQGNRFTAIEGITEGNKVIVGMQQGNKKAGKAKEVSPFMPQRKK
jgi:HlyD family secretion protein